MSSAAAAASSARFHLQRTTGSNISSLSLCCWRRWSTTKRAFLSSIPATTRATTYADSPTNTTTTTTMSSSSSSNDDDVVDIEELHQAALRQGSTTYIDPSTGFTVFTELTHLRRGTCCGNQCRHCPYGWSNVKHHHPLDHDNTNETTTTTKNKQAKLKSGDVESAQRLLQQLLLQVDDNDDKKNKPFFVSTGVANTRPNEEYPEQVPTNIESCLVSSSSTSSNDDNTNSGRTAAPARPTQTEKNVPYTRGGDKGTSQLLTGERRSKADHVFEAMGTIDELCCVVGVVHAELLLSSTSSSLVEKYGDLSEWLLDVMSRLFDIGSHVAKPQKRRRRHDVVHNNNNNNNNDSSTFTADGVGGGFDATHIDVLEEWIDIMTEQMPELNSFILPTGAKAAAQLHVARTVCRRAERRVVSMMDEQQQQVEEENNDDEDFCFCCDPTVLRYLNRLSDFFFTAARYVNYCEEKEEIQYRREYRGAKQRSRFAVSMQQEDFEKEE